MTYKSKTHQCAECSSDGALCHDNGFTDRIVQYQARVLVPALRNMGGLHMLPEDVRVRNGVSYGCGQ